MKVHAGTPAALVGRRDAIRITLATAASWVVAGCQSSGSRSDFDAASKDLRKTLDGVATSDQERARLASIARSLESTARELLDDYAKFQTDFDALAVDRDTPTADLDSMSRQFQARRIAQRDDLLRLQDELRGELTAEEWDAVVETLNRKALSVARSTESTKG